MNIRFTTRALRSVDHFLAIRRDVKIVQVRPNGARREKGLGGNDGGEPNIEQGRIRREEVTHVSLRHVMTRIAKKNGGGGDRGKGKRSVGHGVGRIAKKIFSSKNGINESETRRFVRGFGRIRKIEFSISGVLARNDSGGMTENVRDGVVHHSVLDSTMKRMSRILRRRGGIINTDSLSELGDRTGEIVGTQSTDLIALNDGSVDPTRLLLSHTLSSGNMRNSSVIGGNGNETRGFSTQGSYKIRKE